MSKKQNEVAQESAQEEVTMTEVVNTPITSEIINEIIANCDEAGKAEVTEVFNKLNSEGVEKVEAKVMPLKEKMVTWAGDKVARAMVNIIAPVAEVYNHSRKVKAPKGEGTGHPMTPIAQIDPITGEILAIHEGIQPAARAMQALHNDEKRYDSSICGCVGHKKGFQTAGGFRWEAMTKLPEGTAVGDIVTIEVKPRAARTKKSEAPAEVAAE